MPTIKAKINSKEMLLCFTELLVDFWQEHKYINVIANDKRSLDQNALQFKWYSDLEKQGDMTAEEYRNFCKYKFGMPILLQKDPDLVDFLKSIDWLERANRWNMSIEEAKIHFVSKLQVTSSDEFGTAEMKEYLNAIKNYYEPKGFILESKAG